MSKMGRGWWRVWLFGIGLAAGLGAGRAAPVWSKIESGELTVYTDVPVKEATEFAVGYSAYRAAFRQWVMPEGARLPRSTVVLFRRTKDFERYAQGKPEEDNYRLLIRSTEVDGGALSALAFDGDRETAFQHAFEFETMWALRRVGFLLPLWASQGTGEVFSSLHHRKGKWWFGDEPNRLMAGSEWLDWGRFFEVYRGSPEYRGPKATGAYHAQAWAVMHRVLLESGTDGRARFAELAKLLRSTPGDQVALEALWAQPAGEFSRDIRKHLRGWHDPVEVIFDEPAVRAAFVVEKAEDAAVNVQYANLLAMAGKELESDRLLDGAFAAAPESAVVLEAMARRSLRRRQEEEAVGYYRRAIEAGTTNPLAYQWSATGFLDEATAGGADYAGMGGAVSDDALAAVRQAIALDPGNEESYRILGRALFVAPKVTVADIEELSRGIPGTEEGARVRFYRGLLYDRLDMAVERDADLRALADDERADTQTRRNARERLAKAIFDETRISVTAAVKAHDFDTARATLTKARAADTAENWTESYEQLGGWVDENEAWEKIKAAYEGHRWGEAVEEADAFLKRFPESSVAGGVKQVRTHAKARLDQTPSI